MIEPFEGRQLDRSEEVRVYWSLHDDLYSIQQKVKGRWLVVAHATFLQLSNVRFKVSEAGRQRTIREQCKNVHAFVVGTLVGTEPQDLYNIRHIGYNPFRMGSFYDKVTGQKLKGCESLTLTTKYDTIRDRDVAVMVGN